MVGRYWIFTSSTIKIVNISWRTLVCFLLKLVKLVHGIYEHNISFISIGTTFDLFTSLSICSISSWAQLEEKFDKHFIIQFMKQNIKPNIGLARK